MTVGNDAGSVGLTPQATDRLVARAALVVLALACCLSHPTRAQSNVLDFRLIELNEDGDRTYHNFIYSRSLPGGNFSLEAFALFLPQVDGYQEVGVGPGFKLGELGQVSVSAIGYLALAEGDVYFEPTVSLLDVDGKLTASFFLLHYTPLSNDGIHQWLIDPAEMQYNVVGPVSLGASGYFYRPEGGPWLRKIGPKIGVADTYGGTELAVRHVNASGGVEIQLRRLLIF